MTFRSGNDALRFARRALVGIAIIVSVRYVYLSTAALRDYGGSDFRNSYFFYASFFREHADVSPTPAAILDHAHTLGIVVIAPPLHTPAFFFTMMPLTFLPCPVALGISVVLNQLAILAALVLLFRGWKDAPVEMWAVAVSLTFLYGPLIMDMKHGELNGLVLLGLTAALSLAVSGRPFLAGVCLAWPILYKIQLVGFLLPIVWQRRWRVLAGTLAGLTALVALSLLHFPWERYEEWAGGVLGVAFDEASPFLAQKAPLYEVFPFGISFRGYFQRLLLPSQYTVPFIGAGSMVPWFTLGACLTATLIYLRALGRSEDLPLVWGGAILLTELVSPSTQAYHMVWTLLPVLIVFSRHQARGASTREWAWALAAYLGMCQSYWMISLTLQRLFPGQGWMHLIPLPETLGLCIALGLVVHELRKSPDRTVIEGRPSSPP